MLPPWEEPPALRNIWAKSPRPGEVEGESLATHTRLVLDRLADQRRLHPGLAARVSAPRLWHLLFWASFFHDFGKAVNGFQRQLRSPRTSWGQRHEVVSLAFLPWVAHIFRENELLWVAATVVFHHREPSYIYEVYPEDTDPEDDILPELLADIPAEAVEALAAFVVGAPAIWQDRLGMAERTLAPGTVVARRDMLSAFRNESYARLQELLRQTRRLLNRLGREAPESSAVQKALLMRGLLTLADHTASGHVPPLPGPDLAGVHGRLDLAPEQLYPHQRHCRASRGSVILTAPTGSGKTQAALLWAAARQDDGGQASRLFYVLPFQASMNAMQRRLERIFPKQVGLQHGRSRFALYRLLLERDYTPGEAARLATAATNLARLHYFPVRVLSPYQLLKVCYRLKGYEATLADLEGGLFIFDEIHAYEPRRLALIIGMIRYLATHAAAGFCFMSATFPSLLKGWLGEAVPGLVEITADAALFAAFRRHRIHLLEGELLSENGFQQVLGAVDQGLSVLVCANTVARATAVYRTLAEELQKAGKNVGTGLLHSRFNSRDRNRIEGEILRLTGTGQEKGQPVVLVATQVVEVSLDIDFDTIFTDPAPLDALVQRFGRVNRGRRRDLSPVHIFREPADGQRVYDQELVAGALRILERQDGRPIDEAQVAGWIDEVYQGAVGKHMEQEFRQALQEFEAVCLKTLYPFQSSDDLEEKFYRAFDGVDVLPVGLEEEYLAKKEEDPLGAAELLVNIPYWQLARLEREGRVVRREWPRVVDCPYFPETGLDLRGP